MKIMVEDTTETSWSELATILLIRLGCLWLLVFASLLMPGDDMAFYTFMGVAFIVTIPYSMWMRSKLRSAQFASLQFAVDVVLVTGLVYFTGGIRSDLTLLYPLVILSAGIVGTQRQAVEITILAICSYALMAALITTGVVVEFAPAEAPIGNLSDTVAVFLRGSLFVLFGMAGIYVSKRCRFAGKYDTDLSTTARSLLENMPVPMLLLSKEGRILFANESACEALQREQDKLRGLEFSAFCDEEGILIPESFGRTAYLKRPLGTPLPVAYKTRDFQVPGKAIPTEGSDDQQPIDVSLLAFSDISQPLKTARQLQKVERITAATRIAGEMAHEIRTPLTSISASIQLLRRYEEKSTAADWLPNSPRRKDLRELFIHIEDASKRMDDVIQNFINFAEFSPNDLLSIIKLDSMPQNQGYIGHLNTLGRGLRDGQNTDCGR